MNEHKTFSSSVKAELSKLSSRNRKADLAEIAAYLIYFGRLFYRYGHRLIYFETENAFAAKRCASLLKKVFRITPETGFMQFRGKEGTGRANVLYGVLIRDPKEADAVYTALGSPAADESGRPVDPYVSPALISQPTCKRAFLRAVFISAGNISNPRRSYHFELYADDSRLSSLYAALLADLDIPGKVLQRKNSFVLYIKEADRISDMLGLMGASAALMEFENIRILHDIAGAVNRRSNCEFANIKKTVSASSRQADDIRYIQSCHKFHLLPEGLAELARLRLEYDDIPLKELGEMLNPPLSKSGVNHRMRKIAELADTLRNENQKKSNKEE